MQAPVQRLADKAASWLIPVMFMFLSGVYLVTRDVRTIGTLLIFTSPAGRAGPGPCWRGGGEESIAVDLSLITTAEIEPSAWSMMANAATLQTAGQGRAGQPEHALDR